jgi:hypothetical protein
VLAHYRRSVANAQVETSAAARVNQRPVSVTDVDGAVVLEIHPAIVVLIVVSDYVLHARLIERSRQHTRSDCKQDQDKTSHGPNENKMSDGGRDRVSREVEAWKSSEL